MTDGLELGDVYGATVERIKAQDGDKSRLGMTALMWVSNAERPLGADELCHTLAVQLGSTDFDVGNIPSISTLVSCCQGRVPNGPSKTGPDQAVWSKVKCSLMVEIRQTG